MAKKSAPTSPKRSISTIALEVIKDWKKPYFGAVPYLEAMLSIQELVTTLELGGLTRVSYTSYGFDSSDDIVIRFLCNASTWRGEVAKRCKEELKQHLAWSKHVISLQK